MDADAQAIGQSSAANARLAMARELGDRRLEARALRSWPSWPSSSGDLDRLRRLASEGVAIARETGDVQLLGELLTCLSPSAVPMPRTAALRLEALDCFRQSGDDLFAANEMHSCTAWTSRPGVLDDAWAHITEAIAAAESLGAKVFLYFMQDRLVDPAADRGQARGGARRWSGAACWWRGGCGMHLDVCEVLFGAACCTAWQGDLVRAARLHGAADKDMSAAIAVGSVSWSGAEQELGEREQASLRRLMGDEAYEAAYCSGAGLSRAQAVDLALGREVPG